MRRLIVALCLAGPALGQQAPASSTEYTFDLNGRRVETGSSTARVGTTTVESQRSVNGRVVPREVIEETVLSDGPGGRVIERVVKPYDQTGQPGPIEKQRIEEVRGPDGSVRAVTTLYRGDINGNLRMAERTVTDTVKTGETTSVTSAIERPTLNGGVETVERRQAVTRKTLAGTEAEISTFRRDENGRLFEALRQVAQTTLQGGETVSNLSQFEARGAQLELEGQTVTRTRKQPDGTEISDVAIYRVGGATGQVAVAGKPRLVEQQTIERKPAPGDTMLESVTVREASEGGLGAPRKVSERVLTGVPGTSPSPAQKP